MNAEAVDVLKRTHYSYLGALNYDAVGRIASDYGRLSPAACMLIHIVGPYYMSNLGSISSEVAPFSKVVDGKLYIRLSNDWLLARLSYFNFNSESTVTKAAKELEDIGIFDVLREKDPATGHNRKYYAVTAKGIDICNFPSESDNVPGDGDDEPAHPDEEEEWEPSVDLREFTTCMEVLCKDTYKYEFFKAGHKPMKYMQRLDVYLSEIKAGTFSKNHKFDKPELPKMTMRELADLASKVDTHRKSNLSEVFIMLKAGNKEHSPILEYYSAAHPVPVLATDRHVQIAKETNSDAIRQLNEMHDPEIKSDDLGIMEMLYRIDKYYYDEDVQASIEKFNSERHTNIVYAKKMVFFKWYIMAYRDYRDMYKRWGRDPKYHTLDEWLAQTNLKDDWKGSVWWYFIKYVYETEHVWLTDRRPLADSVEKFVEEQRQRKLRGD